MRKEAHEEFLAVVCDAYDGWETRGAIKTRPVFSQDICWLFRRQEADPKGMKKSLSLMVLWRQNPFRKRGPATRYKHLSLSGHCRILKCVEGDPSGTESVVGLSGVRGFRPARLYVNRLRP